MRCARVEAILEAGGEAAREDILEGDAAREGRGVRVTAGETWRVGKRVVGEVAMRRGVGGVRGDGAIRVGDGEMVLEAMREARGPGGGTTDRGV
jgi:hypothetical protein